MNDIIQCPCCGSYMDRGHLTAGGYRILWTRKDRRWSAVKSCDDVLIQQFHAFSGKLNNTAWRCRGCRKILLDS